MKEGAVFYKAFSNRQTLKSTSKVFDPLQSEKLTPEQCGFGIRMFQLDPDTATIKITQSLKNQVESRFGLDEIVKVVLPQIT